MRTIFKCSVAKGVSLCLALVLLGPAHMAAPEPLEAGVAAVDITPDTEKFHVPLGGYGERMNAAALGVHDPTMAKALVLRQGDRKFALVSLDLLGVPRSLRDEILIRIESTGIESDNLMLAASHSHASVEMNAMNRNNVFGNKAIGVFDEALLLFTADRIAQAITEANAKFVPVRVGAGSIQVPGMNRNRRGDDITDTEMTILRLDTLEGVPYVVFVNYTAHPTYMNAKVMHVSAAWPGFLQREVESIIGAGVVCMYANGAEGDVAPTGGEGATQFERAEDYGLKIARYALKGFNEIETAPDVPLAYSMTMLDLPPRTVPPALRDSAGPEYGLDEDNIQAIIEALVPATSYLGVLQIGDFVGVSIPGEMASVLGLEIKQALAEAGAKHPIIVGLGNEWISYILPTNEYHEGGYEPGVSFYGDQLGPIIVKQAIAAGKQLLQTREASLPRH